jgi:hypothetical protein
MTMLATAGAFGQSCVAESGARRNALVELYTSEGCSSCPPADRQLSLIGSPANANVVPLALHVNFWDELGWKDPYAKPAFTERQRWLIGLNGSRTLYTPHFFVGGREIGDRARVGEAIRAQSARESGARIRATLTRTATGTEWRVEGVASGSHLALFAALTESGLANQVTAGENRGSRLAHDHVVRQWAAPVPLVDGRASLTLDAGDAAPNRTRHLVAFVQDTRAGDVAQALRAVDCRHL